MKRDDRSPEAYAADVQAEAPAALALLFDAVRRTVRAEAPDVEEGIRHGMLDYPGLASLACQEDYVALYVSAAVLEQHRGEFEGIDAGKSCLRFRSAAQLDRVALRRLLRDVHRYRAATGDGSC